MPSSAKQQPLRSVDETLSVWLVPSGDRYDYAGV